MDVGFEVVAESFFESAFDKCINASGDRLSVLIICESESPDLLGYRAPSELVSPREICF